MVYCNISHVITCDTLRWIWCLWYHSECISTPRASLKNMPGHAWNRTYDLWNISPMLCQLSYAVKRGQVISSMSYFGNESSSFWYQYNLAIMIFSVLVLCMKLLVCMKSIAIMKITLGSPPPPPPQHHGEEIRWHWPLLLFFKVTFQFI